MEEKGSFWGKVIFVIALLYFAHQYWENHKERKASVNWPSTNGKIINSYLKQIEHDNHDTNSSFSFHFFSNTDFEVVVRYDYKVDNSSYTGSRMTIGSHTYSSQKEAEQVLRDFKEGKKVDVFYNPLNPSASVLFPGR